MRDGDGSPCVVFESHSASRPTATLNLPILNLQSSKPYTLPYTLHNLHPHSLKSLNLEVSTSKPQTPTYASWPQGPTRQFVGGRSKAAGSCLWPKGLGSQGLGFRDLDGLRSTQFRDVWGL